MGSDLIYKGGWDGMGGDLGQKERIGIWDVESPLNQQINIMNDVLHAASLFGFQTLTLDC